MSLTGRTAVVTGAAMGIGRAMTETLLLHGAKVALLDVNKNAGESLMEALNKQYGPKTTFLECNVESEEQFKAAFQKAAETFGGVDIMCNNAGILNESAWEKMVSINLTSVIRGTYLALEHMNKLTGGCGGVIINTASLAGIGIFSCCPVYTATKHGIVGFTRAMAANSAMSGYGIRFNALCPGVVQTNLISNIVQNMGRYAHLTKTVSQQVGMSESVDVSQVVECFLELVTDETKNGEALVVWNKGKKYATFPSATQ